MSRFDFDYDDGDGVPYQLWEANLSRALGGRRGQEALAEMETALLALPEPKLIEGHLAIDGGVCAIGAFVAHKKATTKGVDITEVIEAMSIEVQCSCVHTKAKHRFIGEPAFEHCTGVEKMWDSGVKAYKEVACTCKHFEPETDEEGVHPTAEAGAAAGLKYSMAWHLAYLNDEKFHRASPEERYEQMLAWVRRAQGKTEQGVTG